MEGKENMSVTSLSRLFIDHETRITKNETALVQSFCYIYNSIHEMNEKFAYLTNYIESLNLKPKEEIKSESIQKIEENDKNEEIIEDEEFIDEEIIEEPVVIKPFKRKRPFFYFITKHFKYKKLLKEKKKIEDKIDIINEYKRQEQMRIQKQQEELAELAKKQQEEEKKSQYNNMLKEVGNILKRGK